MPTEIDVVERRIRQLEIERVALAKETDEASKERLARLDEELANLHETSDGMKGHWQAEKDAITAINSLKEEMETLRGEAERYERNGELAKAMGHQVVALTRGSGKNEKLKELGVDFIVDSNAPQWGASAKQMLGGHRVNLAVENICGPGFLQVIETLAPFAKVSVVGQLAGPVANFNLASLLFRRIRIGGVAASTYTRDGAKEAWDSAVKLLLGAGMKPVVDSIFPFDQLPQAFVRLVQGPIGKVLLDIRNSQSNGVVSPA